MPQTQGLP
jgi:hypothetical protein